MDHGPFLPYAYAYLTGCALLFIVWGAMFALRKDLRREMIFASSFGLPVGLIDHFLVPTYWHPDSLFGLMEKYTVGIESFLFVFLMAGISSVVYEFLTQQKLKKMLHDTRPHLLPFILTGIVFFILATIFPTKAIYVFMSVALLGAVAIVVRRRDLWKQVSASAFLFSGLYLATFVVVGLIYPDLVERFYNFDAISGILFLGVPIEEVATAFFAGAFWSVMYEYMNAYRVTPVQRPSLKTAARTDF